MCFANPHTAPFVDKPYFEDKNDVQRVISEVIMSPRTKPFYVALNQMTLERFVFNGRRMEAAPTSHAL